MKKLFLVSGLFLCALTALVWVGLASAIPIVGVAELGSSDFKDMDVEVKDSKIVAIESLAPLRFSVAPRTVDAPVFQVETERSVPENFKVGGDVGLRGSYDPERKVFVAYHVSTICPSKYEASKESRTEGYPAAAFPAPSVRS